jgi:hypothetical protein
MREMGETFHRAATMFTTVLVTIVRIMQTAPGPSALRTASGVPDRFAPIMRVAVAVERRVLAR